MPRVRKEREVRLAEARGKVRDLIISTGRFPSTRALAAAMDLKSPASTWLLLQRLAEEGMFDEWKCDHCGGTGFDPARVRGR